MKFNMDRALATAGCCFLLSFNSFAVESYVEQGKLGNPASWRTPEFNNQWGLGWIKSEYAYARGYTGKGITVGIYDLRVLPHEEYSHKLTTYYNSANDFSFDANGKVAYASHGSHVAGIVAAARDGKGMHGVAFDASLTAIGISGQTGKPLGEPFLQTNTRIINNSWGQDINPSIKDHPEFYSDRLRRNMKLPLAEQKGDNVLDFFARAAYLGKLMFWAAGNGGNNKDAGGVSFLPYAIPEFTGNALIVTNIYEKDILASSSTSCGFTASYCISAPGSHVLSSVPQIVDKEGRPLTKEEYLKNGYVLNSKYKTMNGTSMSSPMAAGAGAVVMQRFPYMSADQISAVLKTTATDLGEPGIDRMYGWGKINLQDAMNGPGMFITKEDIPAKFYVPGSYLEPQFVANVAGMGTTVEAGKTVERVCDSADCDYDVWSNNIDGHGGLTKTGKGTLELSGNNVYQGKTIIDDGKLNISGSIVSDIYAQNSAGIVTVSLDPSVTATKPSHTGSITIRNGANMHLTGKGESVYNGTGSALLLDSGAKGLTLTDTILTATQGNILKNKAGIEGIRLSNATLNVNDGIALHTGAPLAGNSSSTINVNGSGTGFLFENVNDGSVTQKSLQMADSTGIMINVKHANGRGIITKSSGDVNTGLGVNILDEQGQSALIVQGTTTQVVQSGVLNSRSEIAPVVDINNGAVNRFTNIGNILARDAAHQAINVISNGIIFTNAAGATIRGLVNLLSGENTIVLESGSSASAINSGDNKDIFILKDIIAGDRTHLFTSLDAGKGDDTLRLQNANYSIDNASTIRGMDHIELTDRSLFTQNHVFLTSDAAGNGLPDYNIDQSSILQLNTSTDLTFANHFVGKGTMNLDAEGHHIDFNDNNIGGEFVGTLALSNSLFELTSTNTQVLSNATLRMAEGNITHVGDGEQAIGGLAFDGGTAQFEQVTPGYAAASGTIRVGKMDLLGRGTISVDIGIINNDLPVADTYRSILEQDDAQSLIKLASSATQVQGGAGNLVLKDKSGNLISDGVTSDITQSGRVVAKGVYDYRLSGGDNNDGLYISYGLKQIELTGQRDNAMVLDAGGRINNAADLSAKITGSGDLTLRSQKGQTVTLSNMDNDFSGEMVISSGNLAMQNDNVLGQTRSLSLSADTMFDMRGHAQTIGTLSTDAGSRVNLNDGRLTLDNGGRTIGELAGKGQLNIAGGVLNISGANAALQADTTIASAASVGLDNSAGLGSGHIVNNGILQFKKAVGKLTNALSGKGQIKVDSGSDVVLQGDNQQYAGRFDISTDSALRATAQNSLGTASVTNAGTLKLESADNWQLANVIKGNGGVQKSGNGEVTLLQPAVGYTGITDVMAGTLMLGNKDCPVVLSSSEVRVAEEAAFGGYGATAGNVDNRGILFVGEHHHLASDAAATTFNVAGNLQNAGQIVIGQSGSMSGNSLHVIGDYIGNGGSVIFSSVLNGDKSTTDRMVIDGSSSGSSTVSVTNIGGYGAQTLKGIEMIHVGGDSAGEFTQQGRIVAGAYDYTLARGEGKNAANWYLTSGPSNPSPSSSPAQDTRPEAGAYVANVAAANTLFMNRMHDRPLETHYVDEQTGEENVTSMWMRHVGGHTRNKDSSHQLNIQANRYVMQLGGDIAQGSSDGLNHFRFGVMAGYANQKSNSQNQRTNYHASGSIHGYSLGFYGTWLQNSANESGAYIDSWIQYNWFDNSVSGQFIGAEDYKSKGISTSIESGYTWEIAKRSTRESFFIQPVAQMTWMGVKAHDRREDNGTLVTEGDGNLQTRLGIRAFIKGHSQQDEEKGRTFMPFIEANLLHNTRTFGVTLNGVRISQNGTHNVAELKAGVQGELNRNVSLWGNVAQQGSDKGYRDTSGSLGLKVNF
ncbi:autotransporter outer membrane beta-barrel domain-containing protein [Enterobacter quasiroggenkampii]|uniref:autotransporter outer membrane beta-barrel domain-containing protein n=1 Tax=Enterobacter quasiroggenkampii TaxID=2497436 RepID=UPI0021D08862|nr:autotransporter outer membrane beta-barrel domain-containing protein [Enterobacter quasiroggenkampii]MCU6359052.1 autotransporter outer membrane beta-barrel domain-containing protein [Enterobacter quasiroggenkampii]